MTGEKSWSDWQRERHKVLPLLDIGHSLAGSFPVRHGKTHPRGMPPLELFPECLIFADTLKFFLIWPCLEPLIRGWGGLNFNFQWHGGEGIFDKIISHSIWVCRFLHHRHRTIVHIWPNSTFKTILSAGHSIIIISTVLGLKIKLYQQSSQFYLQNILSTAHSINNIDINMNLYQQASHHSSTAIMSDEEFYEEEEV